MLAYRIEDMTCGHCVSAITRAVRDVDAGARVDVDIAAHLVRIDTTHADTAEFSDAITEAGYTPVQVPAAAAPKSEAAAGRGGCCGGCGCG
jgi:copper chaperone